MVDTRLSENSKRIEYINDIFCEEDDVLKNIGNDLPDIERRMQIGANEGKLLFTLCKIIKAKKIVEIGSLNGYSSIWMARSLPKNGMLYAFEKSSERAKICANNFAKADLAQQTEVFQGNAIDNLQILQQKDSNFDIVFIDADKNNYCNYLDWAEKNVRKGGLIIGDNTFLFGGVYGDLSRNQQPETISIMNNFNKRLGNREKYSSIMIPTLEGMTIALKEF